jgi:hypothetical protein
MVDRSFRLSVPACRANASTIHVTDVIAKWPACPALACLTVRFAARFAVSLSDAFLTGITGCFSADPSFFSADSLI